MSEISQGAQLKWAITALVGGTVDLHTYGVTASAAYEAWLIYAQNPDYDLYNNRIQAYYDLFGSHKTPSGRLYDDLGRHAHNAFLRALTN